MNRERFFTLVKNPGLLKADDAPFLEELIKEYPYFQTAHLLAARCYKITDSIHLQKQIKNAAAHITNRRVLYDLIENFQEKQVIETVPEVQEQEKEDTSSAPEVLYQEEKSEAIVPEINISEEVVNAAKTADSMEVAPVALTEEIKPEESPKNIIEGPPSEDILTAQPQIENTINDKFDFEIPLEQEIKLALAESQYIQEFEHQSEKESIIELKKEEPVQKVDQNAVKGLEDENHATDNAFNESQTSFVAWLKNLNSIPSAAKVDSISEKKEDKIIDAFMEKPVTRVKPSKHDFYSPVNMAKQSVTDNDFFVTETLAKIYIKQGNLAKAIKVYQNLSLKNPEKSSIFAAQIKILKEQLHNKTGK